MNEEDGGKIAGLNGGFKAAGRVYLESKIIAKILEK